MPYHTSPLEIRMYVSVDSIFIHRCISLISFCAFISSQRMTFVFRIYTLFWILAKQSSIDLSNIFYWLERFNMTFKIKSCHINFPITSSAPNLPWINFLISIHSWVNLVSYTLSLQIPFFWYGFGFYNGLDKKFSNTKFAAGNHIIFWFHILHKLWYSVAESRASELSCLNFLTIACMTQMHLVKVY